MECARIPLIVVVNVYLDLVSMDGLGKTVTGRRNLVQTADCHVTNLQVVWLTKMEIQGLNSV